MGWFGTLLGSSIGFLLGGPLGAIGGAALGHALIDRSNRSYTRREGLNAHQQRQAGYFVALFSLMGKIASADGVISTSERRLVEQFLAQSGIVGQQREFALRIFAESATSPHSIADLARQFAALTGHRRDFQLNFMDFLVRLAAADGHIDSREREMIGQIAHIVRMSEAELNRLFLRWGTSRRSSARPAGGRDPYTVLGCTSNNSDAEIKSAYRKLAAAYHPDKIIGKDLPEEFTKFAQEKFQEIQAAYETICEQRNIR